MNTRTMQASLDASAHDHATAKLDAAYSAAYAALLAVQMLPTTAPTFSVRLALGQIVIGIEDAQAVLRDYWAPTAEQLDAQAQDNADDFAAIDRREG